MMALDGSPGLRLAMKVMASVEWKMPVIVFSCLSSGGHFVQQNKTISEILVEGYSRKSFVKLFWNRAIGLEGDVV